MLIVFGAAFVATFGLGAWQADRERSAIQDTQQGLPATEIRLEGPSVQRAAPIGVVDRYDTAERQLSRSLVKVGFGLATATLGIAILARWLAERRRARHGQERGSTVGSTPRDCALRTLLRAWALAEVAALSVFRLMTIAFLYLLGMRISVGEPPTWDVLQKTFDRLIQIAVMLPDLAQ